MRQVVVIAMFCCSILQQTHAQNKGMFKRKFLEAESFFLTEQYREAVNLYKELLETDPENANLNFLIGASYLSIYGEKEESIPYLENATLDMTPAYREGSYKERAAPREAVFALARAYHIQGNLDRAIENYEKYRDIMIKRKFADMEYVNHQIKSCERAKSQMGNPEDIRFMRLPDEVNRFGTNYNPVVSWDDSTLIYISDRPDYRAILVARRIPGGGWTEPRIINEEIECEDNCFPTSLSANGRELYLVRRDAYYGADIYISSLENDRFSPMVPLDDPVNSMYSETHACISFNGKYLFFTSDRPGGQGALDIWVSGMTNKGDWGEPVNLGPRINSFYDEETPFLTANGNKLYFSSQGHTTIGGFDYFVAEKVPKESEGTGTGTGSRSDSRGADLNFSWSYPKNLGYPLSTTDDDLFYYPRLHGSGAYCAVIRKDIDPARSIYTIRIGGEEEAMIAAVRTEDKDRREKGSGEGSEAGAADSTGSAGGEGLLAERAEPPLVPPPGLTEPDEYFVLNSILFDFDSHSLDENARKEADRVFEVLRKTPGLRIELTGHTDAVGADEYNLRLSEQRARAVADYLTGKGIDPSRIRVTAAGETRPIAINRYEDGTDSPEGRRLNRHVSIKLENLQNEKIRVADIFVPDHLRPAADKAYSILLVNSPVFLDTIPDVVAGERTALIITDSAYLYTAGNFDRKIQAVRYLNQVIDTGYPEAGMFEQRDLERIIAGLSEQGIMAEVVYTIQIMALKNPVKTSYFKPLEDVVMYKGSDGLHRYVYGTFKSLQEALARLPSIRESGYDDAFIMSVLRYQEMAE